MITTLNDPEMKSSIILNAQVKAHLTQKVWTTLAPEFSKNAGKTAVNVRALYGLKSTGAAFRSNLTRCIKAKGYESCKADLDLLMKPETRSDDRVW